MTKLHKIFKDLYVWVLSVFVFIIPTISILTIWILIAVHLKHTVDTTDLKGRKSFNRVTSIMGTITTGMINIIMVQSHWSRNVEAVLSLVERFIVLLRQLSYAIKNQLGHPKPPTRGFGTQRPNWSLLALRWFFMA